MNVGTNGKRNWKAHTDTVSTGKWKTYSLVYVSLFNASQIALHTTYLVDAERVSKNDLMVYTCDY